MLETNYKLDKIKRKYYHSVLVFSHCKINNYNLRDYLMLKFILSTTKQIVSNVCVKQKLWSNDFPHFTFLM